MRHLYLGLDLSLRSTGIALIGDLMNDGRHGHITARVDGGDLPKDATVDARLARFERTIEKIHTLLQTCGAPAATAIEDYAFPQGRTQAMRAAELHELGGIVKYHMRTYGPLIIAPIASWRSQLGIPRVPKSVVPDARKRTLEIKRSTVQVIRTLWRVDFGDRFDEADAYALARYAEIEMRSRRKALR